MSTWTRPKPKVYEYNYQIQSSQYRPTLSVLDKKEESQSSKTVVTKSYAQESIESIQRRYSKLDSSEALQSAKKSLEELEERQFPSREPLWKVHPYYVPVERESVPPHEDSIWPESRKHFDLVSSYDCMVGFLGIRGMAEREMTKNVTRET